MPYKLIVKYQIDPKLKPGKDYPLSLIELIEAFNYFVKIKPGEINKELPTLQKYPRNAIKGIPFITGLTGAKFKKYLKELALLERTFLEIFRQPSLPLSADFLDERRRAARKISSRITRRLEKLHPGFYSQPAAGGMPRLDPFRQKKGEFRPLAYWGYLAEAASHPYYPILFKLFHECPSCEKVFFSKQKKRFDSKLCKNKFLIKKRIESGKAREDVRRYRERKAKK